MTALGIVQMSCARDGGHASGIDDSWRRNVQNTLLDGPLDPPPLKGSSPCRGRHYANNTHLVIVHINQ